MLNIILSLLLLAAFAGLGFLAAFLYFKVYEPWKYGITTNEDYKSVWNAGYEAGMQDAANGYCYYFAEEP